MEQRLDRLEAYLNSLTNREEEHTNGAKHKHNGHCGPPGHDHPTVNAPRDLVFAVWTQPEHLIHWWGPAGFTNTFIETDIRTGGSWRYVMHGPDGTDYPNLMSFTEVTPPERVAYLHGSGEDPDPHAFEGAVTFEDEGGKTRITMTSTFATAEARDYVVQNFHAIEGGNQTLDKLAAYLETVR